MRLDQTLVARGLTETRSKARDLILRGQVFVDGKTTTKPGINVREQTNISIATNEAHYISRGGLKLEAALAHYKFSPVDCVAIDVGSSTGGFTDVMLRQGAQHVFAVDVGQDQLHSTLRADDRVTVMEQQDARELNAALIPSPVTAIVSDVSFISVTQALPAAMALAVPGAWMVALIKPQFELAASAIGKGGIVKSDTARLSAIERVTAWLDTMSGWAARDVIESPITGKGGNVEFLIGATLND